LYLNIHKMELIFASQNQNKLIEIQSKLTKEIKLLGLKELNFFEELPETGKTILDNALQKARFIFQKYGKNCFADDTGLEIECLNNLPGVDTAHYAGPERNADLNMNKVLNEMQNQLNRNARFVTVFALILNEKEYLFEGEIKGRIANEKRGSKGFGYDPLFIPEHYELSFAEMDMELKNTMSHRARALTQMLNFLKKG
jgi:XTP/dITP diphosphohydrolase